MSDEYFTTFNEIIEDIETSSTVKQIQLNVKKFYDEMVCQKDKIKWSLFTENCIDKIFTRLFSSDKVFKKFQDDIETDIEKVFSYEQIDKSILFNIFSEYLMSQMRKQMKTLMLKRKYIYHLFETIYLNKCDNLRQSILHTQEGEMRILFINKIFRIQTDFFNFLEESPQALSHVEFFSKLTFIANQLDQQSCLQIVNKIISMGNVELIIQIAIKDAVNKTQKLNVFQETLKLNMISINKYYLAIGHIIKLLSQEIKSKSIQNDQGVTILQQYLQSISEDQIVTTLSDRILFNFTFQTETSLLLTSYFQKHLTYGINFYSYNQNIMLIHTIPNTFFLFQSLKEKIQSSIL